MNSVQPSQKNCKILFVDDSHTEINYLKLLFQITDLPAEPIFINSAQDALVTLKNLEASDFPDFILVDINMPLMNGFEFAENYVENLQSKFPNTKLFIYSTSIHSADINRAKAIEGVTGFISKPFDETSFNEEILPHFKPIASYINSPPKADILSS